MAASKLPRVGTTIFTVMTQLALKHNAVNLGQGFPDFNCDERLQARLAEAVRAGHNQYAPMTGVPALREAIAAKNEALYGHRHDVDSEITVTAGATQAIMARCSRWCNPAMKSSCSNPCTTAMYRPSSWPAGVRSSSRSTPRAAMRPTGTASAPRSRRRRGC